MNKFAAQLGNGIQLLVDGDVHLPVPTLPVKLTENNLRKVAEDGEVIPVLEQTLAKWKGQLQGVVTDLQQQLKNNQQSKRQPRRDEIYKRKSLIQGHLPVEGPTSEINFWRNRNALLSAIWGSRR